MINLEEESLIYDLHQKLSIFTTAPSNLLSSNVKNPILPYIFRHTVTKVAKNKNAKYNACRKAISIDIYNSDTLKEFVACSILHIGERDKVVLTWPSENIATLSRLK